MSQSQFAGQLPTGPGTQVKFLPDDHHVEYYSTLALVRSVAGELNKGMILLGSMTPGDGGGGIFYWNAASTAPDDGGVTTIQPNGVSTGAWSRLTTEATTINGYTTLNGNCTLLNNNRMLIDGASAISREIDFMTNDLVRWAIVGADWAAESGGNVGSNFEMGNFLDSGTWQGPNVVGARTTGNFGFNHGGISFGSQYGSNNTDLSYHLALYSNIWGIGITPNRMNVVMPAGGATQIFANSVMVGWTTSSGLTAGATLGANNGAALRAQNGSYYMAFIGQITASAFNVLCQANDAAIIYSATAMGTGALVIGAQASGAYGIRIDSAAGVSLNNNVTFSGAVASQLSSAAKGGTAYTVGANDSSFILNPSGPMTLTLPSASAQPGRELLMKLYSANAVSSASANVVPLNSATPGTAIMVGTAGKFCQLQSDGTNWQITMAN